MIIFVVKDDGSLIIKDSNNMSIKDVWPIKEIGRWFGVRVITSEDK